MVELEYNGERYMVDGGQWYRRLKVGERITDDAQVSTITMPLWRDSHLTPTKVLNNPSMSYRVPCTDPRPPFVVGQRVKVARKDGTGRTTGVINKEGEVIQLRSGDLVDVAIGDWVAIVPPWCLDPVEPSPADELTAQAQELGMYEDTHNPMIREPDNGPEHEIELHVPMPRNVKATFQLEKRSGETDDIDPELDHILKKLKPLTDRAADVRRIKRECYKQLAALLPEETR